MMIKATAALKTRILLRSKSSHERQNKGTLTTHYKVVKYLQGTYVTDIVISETDADIIGFTRPLNRNPIDYVELLWGKVLDAIECTMSMYWKATS